MQIESFINTLGIEFFVGVPDSQLKGLCNYLLNKYGEDKKHHIIAANEGNSVGIAAGYYMATEKIPLVYMQNSGQGNALNPIASLANNNVYGIPMVLVIGWRGEPNVHDEPQHLFQGRITLELLSVLDIPYYIIDSNTTDENVNEIMIAFNSYLSEGKQVAFVVKKGGFEEEKRSYKNKNELNREKVIKRIVEVAKDSPIISTTGKTSRELFEIRVQNNQSHEKDFLTVGSMGHSSSIALGISLNKPNKKVWCIDGDGAVIMHMGAMAIIGECSPNNLIHVVINNQAHESVGGMPTAANKISLVEIAKGCGYSRTFLVSNEKELEIALRESVISNELCFIEIRCSIGSRKDLGRPTNSPSNNKKDFIEYLSR